MTHLLEVNGVSKSFGGIMAVNDVTFTLGAGVILGIIGPNGSGKTTLLNILNGVHIPEKGTVAMEDALTNRLQPHQLLKRGVVRTFQNPHVFKTVTVYQNMMVPLLHDNIAADDAHAHAMQLLEFVGLADKRDIPASELSGGQQKLLEYARALMTHPRLVLMDEPFGGVHPELKAILIDRIKQMQQQGVAFIIVSHEIPNLMGLSQRVICMNYGKLIADDTPTAISKNEQVVEAYLGH